MKCAPVCIRLAIGEWYGVEGLRATFRLGGIVGTGFTMIGAIPEGRESKRQDALLDEISELLGRKREALRRLDEWAKEDPGLQPALDDLRAALTGELQGEHQA